MRNEGTSTPREQVLEERLVPEEVFKEFYGLQYSAAKTMSEQLRIPIGKRGQPPLFPNSGVVIKFDAFRTMEY